MHRRNEKAKVDVRGITFMSAQRLLKQEEIYYPESDGKPMAETDPHRNLIMDTIFALVNRYRNDPDVYVSGNIFLYYVKNEPRRNVSPDVLVARGIGNQPRRVYKTWVEGKAPDVVIEISSGSTWGEDLQKKWRLYAELGIPEYFIFDPEYTSHLPRPLMGYRLEEHWYTPLELAEDSSLYSQQLGLDLVDTGTTLRLRDPQTQEFLLTNAETDAAWRAEAEARRQAEADWHTEAEARRQAEAELELLRAELAKLRGIS